MRWERCCIRCCISVAYKTNGLVSVGCIADRMQHTIKKQGSLSSAGEMLHHRGLWNKRVAKRVFVASLWLWKEWVSECVFVASVMQHTTELGPLSEVREMLHHSGLWNE